jgi:hypothetical protein
MMTVREANAKLNREKQKRDKQISFFIRKTLPKYLRTRTKRSRKQPLIGMTPAERADAADAMRVFREEDR